MSGWCGSGGGGGSRWGAGEGEVRGPGSLQGRPFQGSVGGRPPAPSFPAQASVQAGRPGGFGALSSDAWGYSNFPRAATTEPTAPPLPAHILHHPMFSQAPGGAFHRAFDDRPRPAPIAQPFQPQQPFRHSQPQHHSDYGLSFGRAPMPPRPSVAPPQPGRGVAPGPPPGLMGRGLGPETHNGHPAAISRPSAVAHVFEADSRPPQALFSHGPPRPAPQVAPQPPPRPPAPLIAVSPPPPLQLQVPTPPSPPPVAPAPKRSVVQELERGRQELETNGLIVRMDHLSLGPQPPSLIGGAPRPPTWADKVKLAPREQRPIGLVRSSSSGSGATSQMAVSQAVALPQPPSPPQPLVQPAESVSPATSATRAGSSASVWARGEEVGAPTVTRTKSAISTSTSEPHSERSLTAPRAQVGARKSLDEVSEEAGDEEGGADEAGPSGSAHERRRRGGRGRNGRRVRADKIESAATGRQGEEKEKAEAPRYQPLLSVGTPELQPAVLAKLRSQLNPTYLRELPTLRLSRFFVVKPQSEGEVQRAIKYGLWSSSESGNRRLETAFRERQAKGGSLLLFVSVNASGHFCGVAQLTSGLVAKAAPDRADWASRGASSGRAATGATSATSVEEGSAAERQRYRGLLKLRWLMVKDVPNRELRPIKVAENNDRPMTNSRDAQEVAPETGVAAIKAIFAYQHSTSLLDGFPLAEPLPDAQPHRHRAHRDLKDTRRNRSRR